LARIQPTIIRLEREKQEQARQAYQLHKSMQPIPGSASDDNKIRTLSPSSKKARTSSSFRQAT